VALALLSVPSIDLEIDHAMSGRTPLMEAALRGNRVLVETLLAKGALRQAQTEDGKTAMAFALEQGHTDLAERLMDAGLPPNANDLLVDAAFRGNLAVVRQLLARGADIEAPDAAGDSALVGAAWGGRDDALLELLDRGASLTRSGNAALLRAANSGKTSIVRLLIGRGVPVDVRDGNGWTPLISAAWQDKAPTVACLLELGADRRLADAGGKTALDWAREGGHQAVVTLLS
jgi:ankyrin repeat protein